MIEIRFHGRGGQGAVSAAELLAQAAFLEGREPQSFPFFGVERRGAPVTAYARIDDRPIELRTAVATPDIVVVLDPGLMARVPVTEGLREGGLLLVNSSKPPTDIAAETPGPTASVDATSIALSLGLGSPSTPIVNTTMLGALARASEVARLASVEEAIRRFVPAKPEANAEAARRGYDAVRIAPRREGASAAPVSRKVVTVPLVDVPIARISSETIHTASWRTFRPVVHLEKCTKCSFCWKFCPDDAFAIEANGFPRLREEFCKGCGICAEECPPKAIEMVLEA